MRVKPEKIVAIVLIVSLGIGTTISARSDGTSWRSFQFAGPVGAWLVDVEFPAIPGAPPPPPPFKETLTFHALGSVSESNTLLNENSYNPALGMGCGFTGPGGALEVNCNGSDGTGVWQRTGRNTLSFVVVKLVFDGATNAQVGYLRIRSDNVRFHKNQLIQDSGDSLTELLIGTDLETAIPVPFGGANSVGRRIR